MTARKRHKLRRDEIAARARGHIPEEMAFPTDRWRWDILGFAREVLGVEWLSERQQEVLLAFQSGTYVTIRGGRKSGKTRAAAICAWWYVCTFPDARVVMTAPVEDSVKEILWRDIVHLHSNARVALGGDLHLGPRTGWRAGLRAIYGRVARDAGGIRGLSGANVAYMLDEASDIPDEIWETLSGNLAGGVGKGRESRALLISNPTRLEGFFYDSHTKDARWTRIHMPAEARDDIPGMASTEWLEAEMAYYGEDSAHVTSHIKGDFPTVEEAKIISEALIQRALKRWSSDEVMGDLAIGVDPATSETHDEAAFAVRRGPKILAVRTYRGKEYEELADIVCDLLDEFRAHPDEKVRVIVDAQGPIGDGTMRALRDREIEKQHVQLIGLHWDGFRRKFPTYAKSYADVNSARWGAFASWLRDGGALIADQKLRDELTFPLWTIGEHNKRKIPRKDEFRDRLRRSPDRADAVINACWGADPQAEWVPVRQYSGYMGEAGTGTQAANPYAGAWGGGS